MFSGALASCSDSTAPAYTLSLSVLPDTVGFSSDSVVTINYYWRSESSTQVQLWLVGREMLSERSPGNWTAVVSENPYKVLPPPFPAEHMVIGVDILGQWALRIPPGRYRIRYMYQLANPDGVTAQGGPRSVDSNPFVVAGT
jgi:hypothetical protein